MLLTEDEARTKECRHGGMTPVAFETAIGLGQRGMPTMIGGIHFGPIQWPSCAASGCMHWRWDGPLYKPGCAPPEHEARGFCGLAGRP